MKQHRSKISYVLLAVIFVVFFTPVFLQSEAFVFSKNLWLLLLLALFFCGIVYLFFTTIYIIEAPILKVKCGPFSYKPVAIDSIIAVNKSSNLIASPAASFDRVSVRYDKFQEIILSPKDKKAFLRDLQEINPKIKTDIV